MLSSLLLALLGLAATPAPAPPAEVRGLWVVRTALVSPQAVDAAVERAAAAGFNTLFVQVRGRGDAFYRSRLVSRSVLLERQPADFDPLARMLAAAHARGMQVHAWTNMLLAAGYAQRLPPDHVVTQHPEWLMVPRTLSASARTASPATVRRLLEQASGRAEAEGLYLSPSAPGVAAHLEAMVRELLGEYEVDGLHLDFIRYPGPEFDWSRWSLGAYELASHRDGTRPAEREAFAEFRRAELTRLVRRVTAAAREVRPGLTISAAVVPDEATAVSQRGQDWPTWMEEGLLDALCPMTYTIDARQFDAQVTAARARVGGRPLWAGVGAYRLDLPQAANRVRRARALGAQGVVVFSHEWLERADPLRFRDTAFPAAVRAGSGTAAR